MKSIRQDKIPKFFSFDISFITCIVLVSIFLFIFISISGSAHAQQLVGFYTNLSGMEEVPPINSSASGLAVLLFNNESSQLTYLVNVTGLDKISQSGIHNGVRGVNGDIVIPLKDNETAGNNGISSILFQDEMKEEDLLGPLFGKRIPDLVNLMSNESAYVNILTERYPTGELRGQLYMGQIQFDNTGAITGLEVSGGVVKLTGVKVKNGVVEVETTRTIGFIPGPSGEGPFDNTDGGVDGVTSVVGELGGVVGKVGGTVEKTSNNVEGAVDKIGGNEKAGGTVEQASSAVVETVDDTGNTLGNTVQKIDDGVVKKILTKDDDDDDGGSNDSDSNDDEKDDDGGSNDSDSNDDEKDDDDDEKDDDDDDDGGSLKDTVKKLLS